MVNYDEIMAKFRTQIIKYPYKDHLVDAKPYGSLHYLGSLHCTLLKE